MADKTYTNQGQVTNLLAAATTAGLIDYTDVIHSGLIKVLHKMSQGNYLLEYGNFVQSSGASLTEFNFNGSTTNVKYLRDNLLVTPYTANTAVTIAAPSGSAGTNRYDLIVLNTSNALAVITGTAHATEPKCPDLRADDIPVAMVEVLGGSSNNDDGRKVQMFPFKKDENSLSIAYNTGGTTYTETMSIYGGAARTTFKNKIANADFRFILADNTTDEKFEIYSDDDSDGDEGDTSVFSVDGLGATSISGALTVGGNIIKASDGGSTITMDTSDNITVGGNIQVGGNIIKASDGGSTITMDTSDNVTIGGGLTTTTDLTVTGGDITYGNSQHATAGITPTAHNVVGKNLTLTAGTTTAGTTNNIAGGTLTFKGGQGKGTGAGGNIVFQTANQGSSGSALNSHATALTISDDLSSAFSTSLGVGTTLVAGTSASSPKLITTGEMYSSNKTPSLLGNVSGSPTVIPMGQNVIFLEPSNAPATAKFFYLLPDINAGALAGAVITIKNVGNQNAMLAPASGEHIDGGAIPCSAGGAAPPVIGLTLTDSAGSPVLSNIAYMAPDVLLLPALRSVTLYAVVDGSLAMTDAGNNALPGWGLGTGSWMIIGAF